MLYFVEQILLARQFFTLWLCTLNIVLEIHFYQNFLKTFLYMFLLFALQLLFRYFNRMEFSFLFDLGQGATLIIILISSWFSQHLLNSPFFLNFLYVIGSVSVVSHQSVYFCSRNYFYYCSQYFIIFDKDSPSAFVFQNCLGYLCTFIVQYVFQNTLVEFLKNLVGITLNLHIQRRQLP